MEQLSALQLAWDQLLNHLQAHLEQRRFHLLYVELNLAAIVLQQEVFSPLGVTLSNETITLINKCLIAVGEVADEKEYRDQLHKTLFNQWQQIIQGINPDLANRIFREVSEKAPASIMVRPRYHFGHDFNALYLASAADQVDRLTRLEGSLERNRYLVYAEIIIPYVRCLIRSRKTITAQQLVALGQFIESLHYIAVKQQPGHEKLWHYLLPLQADLADELIYAHYQCFMDPAQLITWQATNTHKAGESLWLLQTVAHTLSHNKRLSASMLVNWLQAMNTFINALVAHQPQALTYKLLQTEQHQQALADYREDFAKANLNDSFTAAQKTFSRNCNQLLNQLTDQMAQLLGDSPCEWALCVTGSSARLDRRPYSDIELVLFYKDKTRINNQAPNEKNVHVQVYTYLLLSGLEIAIKQLGETHCEYTKGHDATSDTAGFHLDSSCHILRWELFGTPQTILGKYFYKTLPRKIEPEEAHRPDWHDWLHNRKFYALLFPKLVIGNADLLNFYVNEVKDYLTKAVSPSDEIDTLAQALALPSSAFTKLLRQQAIALCCLRQVLQDSQQALIALKAGEVVNFKDTFYKPLTYLTLNLKLYYGLKAEHPANIFAEAASHLSWGEREIVNLLQTALGYITNLQVKLHLQHGHQEERIIWLGNASNQLDDQNAQMSGLSAEDYAGLSFIKDSLLLPLCQWLECQLTKSGAFSLLDVLPYLLKSYLTKRNELWLRQWSQHPSHALQLNELLAHPLISVLADYPSPDGWSPTYEQAMRRWLGQLQSLVHEAKSACLLEGILTSQQKVGYLPQQIVVQLFDAKGEFKGNVHHSAQSKVSQISWPVPGQDEPTTFYFKIKAGNEAGLMGREFAVINLHQLLGGASHIALGWPLKLTYMTDKGAKLYYCWVSEEVPGSSLAEVMQNQPAFELIQTMLDNPSYSHLFITHYLTCPEDAQPDNFKVDPTPEGTFRLYGLDVGQSFVRTYDEARKVLTVKSMLYLLEGPIQRPLDSAVLTRLRLLEPQALINHWQANIEQMTQHFRLLFEAELKKTRVPQGEWSKHNQLIDLTDAIKRCVQLRLELLLNWLYGYSSQPKTGLRLLKDLDKAVAFRYQSLMGKVKTPQDFYQKLDRAAYKIFDAKTVGSGKVISTTTYNQIKQSTLTPERLQRSLDLDEAYFAHIDFSKLADQAEQAFVLKMLQTAIERNQPFSYLNLSGCTIINEQELFALLQKTPALKTLHLANCPQFSLATVFNLLSIKLNERVVGFFRWDYKVLCPQLTTLRLTVEGKVQLFTLPGTIASRKQIFEFTTKWQQQFNQSWNRLLILIDNKHYFARWHTIGAFFQNLEGFVPKLSSAQVNLFLEKLQFLAKYQNLEILAPAIQTLCKFASQLSVAQISTLFKLLYLSKYLNPKIQIDVIYDLSMLALPLSFAQIDILFEKLLPLLRIGIDWKTEEIAYEILNNLLSKLLSETQSIELNEKLLLLLKDESSKIHKAAIQSLTKLVRLLSKTQTNELFERLILLLKDENSKIIHKAAIQSLTKLVGILSKTQTNVLFEKLLLSLKIEDLEIKEVVYQCLGKLTSKLSDKQVDISVEILLLCFLQKSQTGWQKYYACNSLVKLALRLNKTQINRLYEKLFFQLKDKNAYLLYSACESLRYLVPKLFTKQKSLVFEKLLSLLNDENLGVRDVAIESLTKLVDILSETQINELFEKVLPLLKDIDSKVQTTAIISLCELVPKLSNSQINIFIEKSITFLFNDKNLQVKATIISRLGTLVPNLSNNQIDVLLGILLTPYGYLRFVNILYVLIPRLSESQISMLIGNQVLLCGLKDEDPYISSFSRKILKQLAPKITDLSELLFWIKYEDCVLQDAAYDSLVVLIPKLSESQINKLVENQNLLCGLKDKDPYISFQIHKILKQLVLKLSALQTSRLFEKLSLWSKDETPKVQATIIRSLSMLAPKLLNTQVNELFEILSLFLDDKHLLDDAYESLVMLMPRLSKVQFDLFFKKLIFLFKDESSKIETYYLKLLVKLIPRLSMAQVNVFIETLLLCFSDKDNNWDSEIFFESLSALTSRVSNTEASEIFKTLLTFLENSNTSILWRDSFFKNLIAPLIPRLSVKQTDEAIDKLLFILNSQNWSVRCIVLKSLAHFYSSKVELTLLKRTIISSYSAYSEIAQKIGFAITLKIFSFFDQKTSLKAAACVNKEWRCWQKMYLQQQAEQARTHFFHPTEESHIQEVKSTIENSFNRFLPQ